MKTKNKTSLKLFVIIIAANITSNYVQTMVSGFINGFYKTHSEYKRSH